MSTDTAVDLSVIIIARNEEATIGRNLEILVKEVEPLNAEIIVVDSASTDNTRAIAQRFPVTLICMQDSPHRSPAAARYIGTLHARGKYIYYMDGDMIIIPGWMKIAMNELQNPSIGGVAGRMLYVAAGKALTTAREDRFPLGNVESLNTSGMYRKSALEVTSTFNPFLKGEEERELAFRMRRAGFQTIRIPVPMGYHLFKERTLVLEKRKTSFFMGHGQLLRRYGLVREVRSIFKEYGRLYFEISTLYVGMLIFALSLIPGEPSLVHFGLLGLSLSGLLALVLWKSSRGVFYYIRKRVMLPFAIVKGFFLGLPDPAGFERLIHYTVHENRTPQPEALPVATWFMNDTAQHVELSAPLTLA